MAWRMRLSLPQFFQEGEVNSCCFDSLSCFVFDSFMRFLDKGFRPFLLFFLKRVQTLFFCPI